MGNNIQKSIVINVVIIKVVKIFKYEKMYFKIANNFSLIVESVEITIAYYVLAQKYSAC
jgi:hypothetical protein